jgi:hypothetical protein
LLVTCENINVRDTELPARLHIGSISVEITYKRRERPFRQKEWRQMAEDRLKLGCAILHAVILLGT